MKDGSVVEDTEGKGRIVDAPPSPREVMERLYSRSSHGQRIGKERREQIEAKAYTERMMATYISNLPSTRDNIPLMSISKETKESNENFSPQEVQEVTKRLYERSYQSQKMGKERREEIEAARALSNTRPPVRMSATPVPAPPLLVRKRSLSLNSARSKSPSPEEVSNRLYEKSVDVQQAGKERRARVCEMRSSSLPRMNLHGSAPCPTASEIFKHTPHSPPPVVNMKDTVDRLYSRSLRYQEAGRERRVEVNRMRELANPTIGSIRVRDASPARSRSNYYPIASKE